MCVYHRLLECVFFCPDILFHYETSMALHRLLLIPPYLRPMQSLSSIQVNASQLFKSCVVLSIHVNGVLEHGHIRVCCIHQYLYLITSIESKINFLQL